jgi:hypothetical protein
MLKNIKEIETTIIGIILIGVGVYSYATSKANATDALLMISAGLPFVGLSYRNKSE